MKRVCVTDVVCSSVYFECENWYTIMIACYYRPVLHAVIQRGHATHWYCSSCLFLELPLTNLVPPTHQGIASWLAARTQSSTRLCCRGFSSRAPRSSPCPSLRLLGKPPHTTILISCSHHIHIHTHARKHALLSLSHALFISLSLSLSLSLHLSD